MVPPYLIWNRYHVVLPHVHMSLYVQSDGLPISYMKQVSYGPPHVWYDFSGRLWKSPNIRNQDLLLYSIY